MIIFYKCSFCSSHGYRTSKYDLSNNKLIAVKDDEMPEAISYLINTELNHNMILATDENGAPFLGVFGMEDENCEKYVNAVFFDPNNPQTVIDLYHLFAQNYCGSIQAIVQSVERLSGFDPKSGLEFRITPPSFLTGIETTEASKSHLPMKVMPSKQLIAFVSEEAFDDYRLQIERYFSVQSVFQFNQTSVKSSRIDEYETALFPYIIRNKAFDFRLLGIGILVIFLSVLIILLLIFHIIA